MVDTEIVIDEGIETFLVSTFSKIHDEYGQSLDITLALPTLITVVSGAGQTLDDKKYNFIGGAACQCAVRCILAKHYSQYEDRLLELLARKFNDFSRMNRFLWKEMDFKRKVNLPHDIIQNIAGVLFTFIGYSAVEKFIEKAVLHISQIELHPADPANTKPIQRNPLDNYNILINTNGGSTKSIATEMPDKLWKVDVISQLKPTAVLFSHSRIACSKKEARSVACQDILNYLEKNPEICKQMTVEGIESDVVHPLPIDESDYVAAVEPNLNNNNNSKSSSSSASSLSSADPNHMHIVLNPDEDACSQLSRLLLGEGFDHAVEERLESPTKKRMRETSDNMTGIECMFSNGTSSVIKMEQEDYSPSINMEQQQLHQLNGDATTAVNSSSSSSSSSSSATTTVTTTTPPAALTDINLPASETNFNPFIGAEPKVDIHPRIISYFKGVLKNTNNTLAHAQSMPGQAKSIFLSLVVQNKDRIECDCTTRQVGPPHEPVFSSDVVLKSKEYANVIIKIDGVAKKKREAEGQAFQKLVALLH